MEEGKLSIPPLGTENYATWSTRMEAALEYKGLWEYIENDLKEDGNTKADRKARGFLVMNVKDQHLSALAKCQTAKQAWDTLARTYAAKSSARTLLLEKDLNQRRKRLDEPLIMYFSRVRDIRDQLATAGEPISNEKESCQVLLGLPGEYALLATVLETTEKELSLEDLLAKCLVVEQRNTSAPAEDKAYFSKGGRSQSSAGQRAKPTSSESRKCYHCGKPGHLKRDCKKKQRDEQASGRQQDQQQQPSNLKHAFGNMTFSALTLASG